VPSSWPWVLGVDAVGGPPYGYVADECGARVASRRSPDWLIIGSGCEVSNLAGEVGDVLCTFGQVVTPGGMGLNRVWNVWEQGSGPAADVVSAARSLSTSTASGMKMTAAGSIHPSRWSQQRGPLEARSIGGSKSVRCGGVGYAVEMVARCGSRPLIFVRPKRNDRGLGARSRDLYGSS
jgi:hypothetical protein